MTESLAIESSAKEENTLAVHSLELFRFRNLEPQRITFSEPVTVVIGRNGQGKTSLLEAIYLLAHTRSFRPGGGKEIVCANSTIPPHPDYDAEVRAEIISSIGTRELSYRFSGGKRKVFLNGKPVQSARAFFGNLRAVEFSPDDLLLIKGSPTERRTLLDRVLSQCDGGYVETLVQYQRALKQRNRLLSDPRASAEFSSQIAIWNNVLIESGRELVSRRASLLQSYLPYVSELYREILGGSREELRVQYSSGFLREGALLDTELLQKELAERLPADLRRQSTTFGPHRDDLKLELETPSVRREAKSIASQGQTRAIALSLKLAAVHSIAAVTGEPPVVLLDDVESELDSGRREALVRMIRTLKNQVILTTTDSSTLAPQLSGGGEEIRIEGGRVSR